VYYTTGFSREQITDLCVAVNRKSVHEKNMPWPPSLGLFRAVVVTLTYLRRNRVQHELAETFGVSQPTISRAIAAITPMLGEALADHVPTADELDIEQTIANFKTRRIMHTDYRRPIATFTETISAVVALHFYAAG
jgi:hypothetical protein